MQFVAMGICKRLFPGGLQFNKYLRELQILESLLPLARKEAVAAHGNKVVILDQHDHHSLIINGHNSRKHLRLMVLLPIMLLLAVFKTGVLLNHKYLLSGKCHLDIKSCLNTKCHSTIRSRRIRRALLHRRFPLIIQMRAIFKRNFIHNHNRHSRHNISHLHLTIYIPHPQPPINNHMATIKALDSVHQEFNHEVPPPHHHQK